MSSCWDHEPIRFEEEPKKNFFKCIKSSCAEKNFWLESGQVCILHYLCHSHMHHRNHHNDISMGMSDRIHLVSGTQTFSAGREGLGTELRKSSHFGM